MKMAVPDLGAALTTAFGADRVRRDVPLAPMTTFRVGGPADWFLETRSSEEMVNALELARSAGIPVTILGGGSNVLIADAGLRGLVIRPKGGFIERVGAALVRADAAVTINGLVRWTVARGISGLESWAGTPGTVGGAIFGNAHFGGRNIGDLVAETQVVDREGRVAVVPAANMAFAYDSSRLRQTGEVLLWATFRVSEGDVATLRSRARASLAYRKKTQPLDRPSAGCIFRNPERGRDDVPEGLPWSAGALVDRAGAKGWVVGGARVSLTHGNFIVNDGTASAADIRRLIEACRKAVHERFGVDLREEIVYLGQFA
jgi:UDP-N-acetylmuramate dehydrogenase